MFTAAEVVFYVVITIYRRYFKIGDKNVVKTSFLLFN